MAAKVKSNVNPPPKQAPAVPSQPPAPKPLCYGELQQRLDACKISDKSPIRVKMTAIETLFGTKRELYFGIRDIVYTPGPQGKPDLVEFVVQ